MSAQPFAKGDAVAIVDSGGPLSITAIAVVRRHHGHVTGYGTADSRSWSPAGAERCDGFARSWIKPATDEHREAIERRALVGRIVGTRGDVWVALPLDVLRATVAALDAAKAVPS